MALPDVDWPGAKTCHSLCDAVGVYHWLVVALPRCTLTATVVAGSPILFEDWALDSERDIGPCPLCCYSGGRAVCSAHSLTGGRPKIAAHYRRVVPRDYQYRCCSRGILMSAALVAHASGWILFSQALIYRRNLGARGPLV